MVERNRQSSPWQGFYIFVDDAFQEVLKHFADRKIAVQRLKELELWSRKDGGRWRETDMDEYGLYIHVSQTSDGWHASIRMQPGRIGIEDFDSLSWAFLTDKVDELCNSSAKERTLSESTAEEWTLPGARRGRKVKYDWPVFESEFFGRLFFDDVEPHGEINIEQRANDLMTWGQRYLGDEKTPGATAMRENVTNWWEVWKRRPPKPKTEELRKRKTKAPKEL